METEHESIIRKIKALLSKGQSTDNLHEKATFIAHAHKLMATYNVTLTDDKEEVYSQKVGEGTKSVSLLRKSMATALAKHYGCDYYLSTKWDENLQMRTQRMIFVGTKITVDTFLLTFDFCWESFITLCDIQLKTECKLYSTSAKRQFKNDYLVGFNRGVTNELIKSINQFGLVVTIPQKVKDHIDQVCTGIVKTKSLSNNVKSPKAVAIGYTDGSFAIQGRDKTLPR